MDQQQLFAQYEQLKAEIRKRVVGQEDIVEQVMLCLLADGHALLEGLPGLGKTMLIRTISEALSLDFRRIQFTPDLMPSDITGTVILEDHRFVFHEGPLFANIVLADEVNRATPKTQSALLEAMGEKTVTVLGETRQLERPFFVLATQNPLEQDGTFPLPEAQMDRFLMKVHVAPPTAAELKQIIRVTTEGKQATIVPVLTKDDVLAMQQWIEQIVVSDAVLDFAVHCLMATQPTAEEAPEMVQQYVAFGAGPRGLQAMIKTAKARAFTERRLHVTKSDIRTVLIPCLRHRIFLNFEAEANQVKADDVLRAIMLQGVSAS